MAAIFLPCMIDTFDLSAEVTREIVAVKLRQVGCESPAAARGDQVLQPRLEAA